MDLNFHDGSLTLHDSAIAFVVLTIKYFWNASLFGMLFFSSSSKSIFVPFYTAFRVSNL